jgi:hypothetical protein
MDLETSLTVCHDALKSFDAAFEFVSDANSKFKSIDGKLGETWRVEIIVRNVARVIESVPKKNRAPPILNDLLHLSKVVADDLLTAVQDFKTTGKEWDDFKDKLERIWKAKEFVKFLANIQQLHLRAISAIEFLIM